MRPAEHTPPQSHQPQGYRFHGLRSTDFRPMKRPNGVATRAAASFLSNENASLVVEVEDPFLFPASARSAPRMHGEAQRCMDDGPAVGRLEIGHMERISQKDEKDSQPLIHIQ
ncbi:hypothetical protein E4U19_003901 [Claviceps sp. Clav32 group G5]|nr:hypothetical protein E4U19_003901 [Claviceps sp. Clav32 group G5]KAG6046067.1 hypothetical protein E4U39_001668 [Claviceps sp. Clav50 group G5]